MVLVRSSVWKFKVGIVKLILDRFGLLGRPWEQTGPWKQVGPREWAAQLEQAGPREWVARLEQAKPREWVARLEQAGPREQAVSREWTTRREQAGPREWAARRKLLEVCPQSHSFDVIAFGILIVLNFYMFNEGQSL
ncbi:hypothetical protein ACFX1X_009758 [Malus domestica]